MMILWVLSVLQVMYNEVHGTCPGNANTENTPLIPFYLNAHMLNSIKEIQPYLKKGANSFEFDIKFYSDGRPKKVNHGWPCDCFRWCLYSTPINEYMDYLWQVAGNKSSSEYSEKLCFLRLDLKLKESISDDKMGIAGRETAKLFVERYFKNDPLSMPYILLGVQHISQKQFYVEFYKYLKESNREDVKPRIGHEISLSDDAVPDIIKMYKELNITEHIWLADGLTSCLNFLRGSTRLQECIDERNRNPMVAKVYAWSLDLEYKIRDALCRGVDSIQTNKPDVVLKILNEPEFKKKYRLATRQDNAWAKSPAALAKPGN